MTPLHETSELLSWIEERKASLFVELKKIPLEDCSPWFYDDTCGEIRNTKGTFFQIAGIRQVYGDGRAAGQPIIIQDEIGFLGIICCKINGVWHYLMQAKIEPGNVNVVQLSPTIQATKSNFTQQHGGRKPQYLDYFLDMNPGDILVDQIQSEQSSRFRGKRNRNVILKSRLQLEESDTHKWMTLPQIKEFMRHDNLVNMDTRTVLSCIPYVLLDEEDDDFLMSRPDLYRKSVKSLDRETIVSLYSRINDYKMFHAPVLEKVPLFSLDGWAMEDGVFRKRGGYPFEVIFCSITIEGREVSSWKQPLFAANGISTFGLLCCNDGGMYKFLVSIKPEIGCFDSVEIGPTVQEEPGASAKRDCVSEFFFSRLQEKKGIVADVLLSEEGGRFYQEQNRNVIIQVNKDDVQDLPDSYVWSDYGTLNILTQVNNCLNIQLRNLLSLLEI